MLDDNELTTPFAATGQTYADFDINLLEADEKALLRFSLLLPNLLGFDLELVLHASSVFDPVWEEPGDPLPPPSSAAVSLGNTLRFIGIAGFSLDPNSTAPDPTLDYFATDDLLIPATPPPALVPEPSTALLVSLGLITLGTIHRRR